MPVSTADRALKCRISVQVMQNTNKNEIPIVQTCRKTIKNRFYSCKMKEGVV